MKLHVLLNAPPLALSFLHHLLHSHRFPCTDFPQENRRSRLIGTGRQGCLFMPLLSLLVLCDLPGQSFLPPESKFAQRFTCEAFLVGCLSGMKADFFWFFALCYFLVVSCCFVCLVGLCRILNTPLCWLSFLHHLLHSHRFPCTDFPSSLTSSSSKHKTKGQTVRV